MVRNEPPKKYVKDDDGKLLQLNPEYKSWKDGEESIVDDDGHNNNNNNNNNHHTMASINIVRLLLLLLRLRLPVSAFENNLNSLTRSKIY